MYRCTWCAPPPPPHMHPRKWAWGGAPLLRFPRRFSVPTLSRLLARSPCFALTEESQVFSERRFICCIWFYLDTTGYLSAVSRNEQWWYGRRGLYFCFCFRMLLIIRCRIIEVFHILFDVCFSVTNVFDNVFSFCAVSSIRNVRRLNWLKFC